MAQTDQPLPVLSSDEIGLEPERAVFERAATLKQLDLARDPEWFLFEGDVEENRVYYNKRTNAAW